MDVDELTDHWVHHDCFSLLTAMLQIFPSKILNHGGEAACSAIIILAESCCASLDSFDLVGGTWCRSL